ncbi:hypothetical protein O4U47_05495 [Nocardiopsis sp. LSu2-4]|uniref:Uncharacterized protein n=1 Tax=Nocardiopsis suaedae TaxID=3018444 RepID=A0ABT4TGV6_9ACTN|nr:hypothetical protein [Nocardiopsis suaedae]MDA2803957.1 hypothetical protein [Nocardiopsis suaedae]
MSGRAAQGSRGRLGLPVLGVIGLALLGVPRVVAHDLGLVGAAGNAFLVWAPLTVWVAVVLWRRVPNPLVPLIAVGVAYGVLLAVAHQATWAWAFDTPPALGGGLEGVLPPAAEGFLMRGFSFVSSLFVGTLVGAGCGVVAWLVSRAIPGYPRTPG